MPCQRDKNKSSQVCISFVALFLISFQSHCQIRDNNLKDVHPAFSLIAESGADSAETKKISEIPIEVHHTAFELQMALIESFIAFGLDAHITLFNPVRLGARVSVDVRDGSIFFVPYIGCSWPGLGGFEIGNLYRPNYCEWKTPYWESWRVWMGDLNVFYLSAGVLSNVPIMSVGNYEIGIGFGLGKSDNVIWFGVTSIGTKIPQGPAIKTQWQIDHFSWIVANGSFAFNPDPGDTKFTLSIGYKIQF